MQVKPVSRESAQTASLVTTQTTRPNAQVFRDQLLTSKLASLAQSPVARTEPIHTVKTGDTLTGICKDYLRSVGKDSSDHAAWVAVRLVARSNRISNPDFILPGETINLSALQDGTASATPLNAQLPQAGVTALSKAAPPPYPVPAGVQTASAGKPGATAKASALAFHDGALASSYLNRSPKAVRHVDLSDLFQSILNPATATAKTSPSPTSHSLRATSATSAAAIAPALANQSPWSKLLSEPAHLTSGFGPRKDPITGKPSFHPGIDLAADRGTEIFPVEPGTVTFSGWMGGYGNVVIVHHQDGLESLYGHNSVNLAKVGEKVTTSTPIGRIGSTGHSTGPHLHFEIREHGVAVNPIPLMETQLLQVAKTF